MEVQKNTRVPLLRARQMLGYVDGSIPLPLASVPCKDGDSIKEVFSPKYEQ